MDFEGTCVAANTLENSGISGDGWDSFWSMAMLWGIAHATVIDWTVSSLQLKSVAKT